ncbi:EAL domain-containing protein [Mangrovibacter plantisponsor]|uniref:EAL domain-containing protein (Putative c-di-GMP-specific phosphodiesterase class I) n=1 Tax=Mangrovibacter plantisponsor TaxID=451513 RepID=A0A317PXC2_9ENTR|nr:EAL domain-containing protein [Mangrovibacter plantisponsor]PWW07814.1 EAL domain-containing protein (putative c-di-GMP-specific phosphodiesterase class I) [Mangrovibacter plantisponsor]
MRPEYIFPFVGMFPRVADGHMQALANALNSQRELCMHWQPIINLQTGKITSMEALVRWHHPVKGWIKPAEFVQQAEKQGLSRLLTRRVITLVLAQLTQWKGKGLVLLPVSVNVFATDLSSPGFAEYIIGCLTKAGIAGNLLIIECIETASLLQNEAVVTCLNVLRSAGVRIALDDFGAGYSNIGCLGALPLDIIKLDRSLIKNIRHDAVDVKILQHTVRLLSALNYGIVAEGIEHQEEMNILQLTGCNSAQGFYFSPPVAGEQAEQFIRQAGKSFAIVSSDG